MYNDCPTISVIIPTYNSENVISECLKSIRDQNYTNDKIEIIIADGGSTDDTLKIAKKFNVEKIIHNHLKTGEAGKAAGLKVASNELVAFIDSDNVLPDNNWFNKMVTPFRDIDIVGSEPIQYTLNENDHYINRYCALTGVNDPIVIFLGRYPYLNLMYGNWTKVIHTEIDMGGYIKIKFESFAPAGGANGFIVRRKFISKYVSNDYYFDIDIFNDLFSFGKNNFAKVKVGITHNYCDGVGKFIKKQKRRIKDYLFYNKKNQRQYPWNINSSLNLLKFIIYTVFILPLMLQSFMGYTKKRDLAWFFHVPACWITLIIYSYFNLKSLFIISPESREKWSQ